MNLSNINEYIQPNKKAHLVGIGGVSMAPLGEVLLGMGMEITGSDMSESATVARLRSLGIDVAIGHLPQSVHGAHCVIRTAAVHDDNPEIAEALRLGIPVFERAQAWGAIMAGYTHALCISGTHGKTTTTSMCTHITMAADLDPTVMIGGNLPLIGAGHRVGQGDTIVLESCEYCNSFHAFHPTVAVILNVEADHLDFFKDLADVEGSFRTFANLVPDHGCIVANWDDQNVRDTLSGVDRPLITFGLEEGDVHAANLVWEKGLPSFDAMYQGEEFAHIVLNVPGTHNVLNALAATASAIALHIPAKAVEDGLATFLGAGRRFEAKGTYNGADVYDDYAHHPSELKALLSATSKLGYKRVVCAFQPHTYTRTHALFGDFVEELKQADLAVLAEIYAARETNELGISSKDLADQIPGSQYFATLEEVTAYLGTIAQPGDLILTVGAGNIYTAGEALVH